MEESRRTRTRYLTTVALLLGYSATVACSTGSNGPAAPSPGLGSSGQPAPITSASPTPTPGTGETKPGIALTAVPRPDGSFDITENLMLPEATDILPVQLPASGEHLPGIMARTAPRVTNLKLLADNQSVRLETTTLTAADYLPLTAAATRIQLTYRLSGSTVRALPLPSPSTRAAAAIRPLTAGTDSTLPTDVTVTGGLLNAVCPLMTETRCAVGDPPDLTIQPDIPAGKALVVLQLDLPR
ncbi:hypothetical protein [Kribbella speibonae]|uniref:hypothetical protein n=1 Tax=Kribbella speibonae TaxID=1572660 RepID=UPI001EDF0D0C|nr:hypothetical protein [Kribbella speibonae]